MGGPERVGTIEADVVELGDGVNIAPTARIRARRVSIGDNCFIGDGVVIDVGEFVLGDYSRIQAHTVGFGVEALRIGRNCWIGGRCDLDSQGGLDIYDNVGIGSMSQVWSHIRHGDVVQGCRFDSRSRTVIEQDAWLVGSCLVSPVRVGRRSMALLGSVVTRDLAPDRTFAGVPATDVTDRVGPQFAPITDVEKARRLRNRIEEFEVARPEFRGRLRVVMSRDEVLDDGTTSFIIAERTYTKRGGPAESEFLKSYGNVKFIPLGEPDPF